MPGSLNVYDLNNFLSGNQVRSTKTTKNKIFKFDPFRRLLQFIMTHVEC